MGKVFTHMTMSLDGYIATPDDGVEEIFEWYSAGDIAVPSANKDISFKLDEAGAEAFRSLTEGVGLVDEVCVSLAPVLLGDVIPYFTKLAKGHQMLKDPEVIEGHRALHLRYPVRR